MNLKPHLFIGGGPIDGFRFVHESAVIWQCRSYTPPDDWGMYTSTQAVMDSPLGIKIEIYHRKGARLFIHESEV